MIAERGVWARRRYRGFEQPARQVPQELVLPRKPPRETDFAAERPKGDGFRLVSVSLARFRDIPPGKLPRGAPRVTVFAARCPKGDGFRPIPVSPACFHGIPTGQLPRDCPRETDFAARHPEGDGFRPIPVSLACSRGTPMGQAAAERPEGDGFCREASQGRRISPDFRLPRAFPWHPPLSRRRTPPLARKRPASKGGPSTQNYVRVLELTGSARRRGKKKCTRRTRCTRPR